MEHSIVYFLNHLAFVRIHNGMHYLTDVLGGIVFGAVYGFLAKDIVRAIRLKLAK